MLWQLMNIVHVQLGGGLTPTPEVMLARLIPYAVIEENIAGYSVLELLQMMLNYVHEAAHSVYINMFTMGQLRIISWVMKCLGKFAPFPLRT